MSVEQLKTHEQDPRVDILSDPVIQLAAHLPIEYLLGQSPLERKLPLKTLTFYHRWIFLEERMVVVPVACSLLEVEREIENNLILFDLNYERGIMPGKESWSEFVLAPLGQAILKDHPNLLHDLFVSDEPLIVSGIEIEPYKNIKRIKLPDHSFLLKGTKIENGISQLNAFRAVRNRAQLAGYSPEKPGKIQIDDKEIFLAITAPEPLFATGKMIAMTELEGLKEPAFASLEEKICFRAEITLRKKTGFNLYKEFDHFETLYGFDEKTGITTVAFVDIHALGLWAC